MTTLKAVPSNKKGDKKTDSTSKTGQVGWDLIMKVLACAIVTRIYLFGPPGTGKTMAAYKHGSLGRRLYAVTLIPEAPAAELRGMYLPVGDTLQWCDGPVIRAMKEGACLVLNEITHASEDAAAFLYPVIELADTSQLTLPTGEIVRPAEGFRCIVTDNLPPDDLPAALRDRFEAVLEVTEPHPDALARLSEPLREIARRGVALDDERRFSIRPILAIDKLRQILGLRDACLVVLGAARGALFFDALRLAGVEE